MQRSKIHSGGGSQGKTSLYGCLKSFIHDLMWVPNFSQHLLIL